MTDTINRVACDQVYVWIDPDGDLRVTGRWDVAKHIPYDVTAFVRKQGLVAAPREPIAYQCRMKTTREGSQWRNWHEISRAEYDLYLANPGPNSVGVIREVRQLTEFVEVDLAYESQLADQDLEIVRKEAVIVKFEAMLREAYELLNTGERSQALRERIAEALPKEQP